MNTGDTLRGRRGEGEGRKVRRMERRQEGTGEREGGKRGREEGRKREAGTSDGEKEKSADIYYCDLGV